MKSFYLPKESIYRHFHFVGNFEVRVPEGNSFQLKHYGSGFAMESDFFWRGFGGSEKISCQVWAKLSLNTKTILDIGANTGVYSLIASCTNQKALIYAFEPSERIFAKLKENIALNNFSIIPLKMAIAEHSGIMTYYDIPSENPYTGSLRNNSSVSTFKIEVPTIRLIDFIENENINSIELIKIDVEEYEPEVLRSMGNYLTLFKPSILIEILNERVASELMEILKTTDYQFYNINEELGLIQTEKLEKGQLNNYLICTESAFTKASLSQFKL